MRSVHAICCKITFLGILSAILSGCSVLGFGVGSLLDATRSECNSLSPAQLRLHHLGESIRILQTDSSKIEGDLKGVDTVKGQSITEADVFGLPHNLYTVRLAVDDREVSIPSDRIMRVDRVNSRHAKWNLMIIGLPFDIFMAGVLIFMPKVDF